MARQTDAQIGIFGHIMRIPSPQLFQGFPAKKQRGAAKRDRQTHMGKAGQHNPEPACIFDRKAARQPVRSRIIKIQYALQARNFWPPFMKVAHDTVQLVGFWRILGVINADNAAAAEIHRKVQCPWFGFERPARHHHDPHPAGQGGQCQRFAGQVIFGLDDKQNVEQFPWIIQPA